LNDETTTSLLHGWFPASIAVLAWGTLLFGVAWRRSPAWQWVATGAACFVGVLVLQVALDVPARVGSTYPASFLVWAWLPIFAFAALARQWPVVAWWRRALAIVSVPSLVAFGALQINDHYAYLPTLGDLLGAPLPGQVNASQLTRMPTEQSLRIGRIANIDIPSPVSQFVHRRGFVWLPPSYFARSRSTLSVLMLLAGTPGSPSDWLRGGRAFVVANRWAANHHGDAPIMVFPDANGHPAGDTECVDSPRGAAETYLTVDVPVFVHTRFGVSLDPRRWAVAGLSEGGTCALELAARHPERFATFADYSGDAAPRIGSQANTIRVLYGGSKRERQLHDPTTWFRLDAAYGVAGVVAVGSNDKGYLRREQRIVDAAVHSQMQLSLMIERGGDHSFRFWAHALAATYPWLVARLESATR
jgi:enterochelin esterase-like enzyme